MKRDRPTLLKIIDYTCDKKSKLTVYQIQLSELSEYHDEITQLALQYDGNISSYQQSTKAFFKAIALDPKKAVLEYYQQGEKDMSRWQYGAQATVLSIYRKTIILAKLTLKTKLSNQENALSQFQQQHKLPVNYFHELTESELRPTTIIARPPPLPTSFFAQLNVPEPAPGASTNWLDSINWTELL